MMIKIKKFLDDNAGANLVEYIILVGVIGCATLLTFHVSQTDQIVVDVIIGLTGTTEASRIADLRRNFPYGALQSVFLVVVFYLMVNLFHRARDVVRSYAYLHCLEDEIRDALKIRPDSVAFTREGAFYAGKSTLLTRSVKWIYALVLGTMLLAFLVGRFADDAAAGNTLLAVVDVGLALPTLAFYYGYLRT